MVPAMKMGTCHVRRGGTSFLGRSISHNLACNSDSMALEASQYRKSARENHRSILLFIEDKWDLWPTHTAKNIASGLEESTWF